MDKGLGERLFRFAVDVIFLCKEQKSTIENNIIVNQLVKAATSIGANYEEAQGAISRADFRNKIKISLKEARESNYWLRIFKAIGIEHKKLNELISESEQLTRILGKISSSSRS